MGCFTQITKKYTLSVAIQKILDLSTQLLKYLLPRHYSPDLITLERTHYEQFSLIYYEKKFLQEQFKNNVFCGLYRVTYILHLTYNSKMYNSLIEMLHQKYLPILSFLGETLYWQDMYVMMPVLDLSHYVPCCYGK